MNLGLGFGVGRGYLDPVIGQGLTIFGFINVIFEKYI